MSSATEMSRRIFIRRRIGKIECVKETEEDPGNKFKRPWRIRIIEDHHGYERKAKALVMRTGQDLPFLVKMEKNYQKHVC